MEEESGGSRCNKMAAGLSSVLSYSTVLFSPSTSPLESLNSEVTRKRER